MTGLALERSDRPGLSRFLARHRACAGGVDVRRLLGPDGSMIRVTCTQCGQAIEAPAASWEGWWEESTDETPSRARFDPSRDRPARRRRPIVSPRVKPLSERSRGQPWRRPVAMALIAAWSAAGLVLIGLAIL